MRPGAVTTGVAPPADTGPPLSMECPLLSAVLARSNPRDRAGAGRDTHQVTYDVYYHPHRSPGRPANDEFNPSEPLECRRAPVSVGALATSGAPMFKLGPILTLNPFIWMSSGTLSPSTDGRSSTYRLATTFHSLTLSLSMNPELPCPPNLPSRGPPRTSYWTRWSCSVEPLDRREGQKELSDCFSR